MVQEKQADLLAKNIATWMNEAPATRQLFESWGLDLCCGGALSLSQAVGEKRIENDFALKEIQRVINSSKESGTVSVGGLNESGKCDNESGVCSDWLPEEEELQLMIMLSEKIAKVHGDRHPELHDVNKVVSSWIDVPPASSLLRQELNHLSSISDDFTMPADGCGTYQKAYSMLNSWHKKLS